MIVSTHNDFLEQKDFDFLKKEFLSNTFPYYYNDFKVNENDGGNQFTHIFYREGEINSDYFDLLSPILNKLKVQSIERIKLNMTIKENKIEQFDFHTDTNIKCNTAIFYFNTNNGKTIFESGEEVSSVENKMIIFPSSVKHTGTTHTDTKYRLVLNLNYN